VSISADPRTGSVFVGNAEGGTAFCIDPGTGRVVATIRVGLSLGGGIAVGDGGVWVDVHPS
jgi:YVTN family beta-propeller protein